MVFLLPFAEQISRYEILYQEMQNTANLGYPWICDINSPNIEAARAPIPHLICPSDGKMRAPITIDFGAGTTQVARSNIAHSLGDGLWGNNTNETGPSFVEDRGIMTPNSKKSFGNMTDGSSNTIGLSEIVGTERDGNTSLLPRNVLGDVAVSTGMHNGVLSLPGPCLLMRDPTDRTQLLNSINAWRGGFFTDGKGANVAFTTTLPPNSPSCIWWEYMGQYSWGSFSPSSFHTGGVNAVRMDGSVTFISDTIDTGNLDTPLDVTIPASPYGVWGALGTPAGGESISL